MEIKRRAEVNTENTRCWLMIGLMLGQSCRRRTNFTPTLGRCLVLAETDCADGYDNYYSLHFLFIKMFYLYVCYRFLRFAECVFATIYNDM